ncbi:MAG: CYTH domain-containing protein, partial [Beijerinckiaceae bacterium]
MPDEAEIELKFLFAERDATKVMDLVAAASGDRPATHQHLRTIYFDTPDQDIWNHGFSLRVRASGDNHVQTVKRTASSGIQRDEWEAQTGRPELDLGLVKNTPHPRHGGNPYIRRAIRPAVEMEVERTSVMLEVGAG